MSRLDFNDPIVSEEMSMLRAQVRRFVDEVVLPNGDKWEADGEVPREVFLQLGEMGLLGMRHPEQYGGSGLGAMSSVILGEELGRGSYGGLATGVTVHSDMSISHIAHNGSHEQKTKYLPLACSGEKLGAVCVTEAHAGSDVAGIKTRAIKNDKGWLINGSKMFITNGANADIYIVAAKTNVEVKGSRGISMFIVDRDTQGFSRSGKMSKHGWRSSDTVELYFDDMQLPEDALLGEEGKGFYYIMSTFQNERLVAGAMSVGQCLKAIELTRDYAQQRNAFGKTLWEQPVVRNKLAWMASKTAAARSLVYSCAEMIEQEKDAILEVSMLKSYACETLNEVVHGCLQLTGGTGFMTGTPIERMARDARILTIGGGATEVMLEEVAKRM